MSSSERSPPNEARTIRRRKGIVKPVSAPMSSVPLRKVLYALAIVVLAYAIYYTYRMSQIKTSKFDLLQQQLRKTQKQNQKNIKAGLELKISELADMVGVSPDVMAKAVAGAVKPPDAKEDPSHIPREALKVLGSIAEAKRSQATETPPPQPAAAGQPSKGGIAATILSVAEAVGFDDMGVELD